MREKVNCTRCGAKAEASYLCPNCDIGLRTDIAKLREQVAHLTEELDAERREKEALRCCGNCKEWENAYQHVGFCKISANNMDWNELCPHWRKADQ